jgi:rubrerythrin
MPEFGNAFSGLAAQRKLTHQELVRAVRMMIAAEYEAVQLYMQLAESIDNELAKVVLKDIADEEIVHAGEFLTLLQALEPSEAAFYAEGAAEVQEMMTELSGTAGAESAEPDSTPAGPSEPQAPPEQPTVGNLFGR